MNYRKVSLDHTYAKMVSSPPEPEAVVLTENQPEREKKGEEWPVLAKPSGSAVSPVARRGMLTSMPLPPATVNRKKSVIKQEVATGSNDTVGLAVVTPAPPAPVSTTDEKAASTFSSPATGNNLHQCMSPDVMPLATATLLQSFQNIL